MQASNASIAWNSGLESACLQTGKKKTNHLHMLSCYAPTYVASRAEKDNFFDMLQQALACIPPMSPTSCWVTLTPEWEPGRNARTSGGVCEGLMALETSLTLAKNFSHS